VASPKPQSLDAWITLLDNVRLPVPRSRHERVRSAILDSRRSLRDIADLMQESPALVLSVLREANRAAGGSLAEPAESLEVALNRLGLKRTEQLLAQLPAVDDAQIPRALRQLQLISQHATQQANGLFAGRMARLWQDIHWGSLLFLSPLWPLALSHPGELEEWERRVVHKGQPAARVERELFGVSLLTLCQALAAKWRLPGWVQHGYRLLLDERRLLVQVLHIARDNEHRLRQQQQLDDNPALRHWLNQPANTVVMANGLALAAHHGWQTPSLIRWQWLTSLYLQIAPEALQSQTHHQAVNSARQHAADDLWHPALALLWPWGLRHGDAPALPAAAPAAEDMLRWRKHCAELLAEPSAFTNAMRLTTCARDALLACGMQRVMLLMTDKSQAALRVHQASGVAERAVQLQLPIEQSPVLQRLMSKAAQIRLTPANSAQFSPLIPPALRQLFEGEHVLLRSLASNGRTVMLVVADQGGAPFAEVSVQAFGKTAQCIERALTTFTNRSR